MKTTRKQLITAISSFLLAISAVPLASCGPIKVTESVKAYKREYKMNEVRMAEQNTFRKLNNISYPDGKNAQESTISNAEKEAYDNFSNTTYHALVNTSGKDNFSYATIGLYSLMNEMYGAVSREYLKVRMDTLLGLSESQRISFYTKLMKANSFANENSTTQLKNAAFFNNFFNYSADFVTYLTNLYCEAYTMNFSNEADRIVEWVNKAVNSDGFIDKNFLEMTEDTELYLFSTLYFKNMWATKYLKEDNVNEDFYLSDGSTIKVDYMKHSYMTESYYDYGKYISVTDYYRAGNASITYIVPKKIEDNIFDLTKDVNIFSDDEAYIMKDESEYREWFTVNLKTPKFNLKTDLDFEASLTSLGFGDMFDDNYDSFSKAFDDPKLIGYNIFVDKMKQKNEVEFNEDGSIVKSVSMASFSKAESAAPGFGNTLDVELDQPFIYIIRDVNNTPIFVGHVDNPKA